MPTEARRSAFAEVIGSREPRALKMVVWHVVVLILFAILLGVFVWRATEGDAPVLVVPVIVLSSLVVVLSALIALNNARRVGAHLTFDGTSFQVVAGRDSLVLEAAQLRAFGTRSGFETWWSSALGGWGTRSLSELVVEFRDGTTMNLDRIWGTPARISALATHCTEQLGDADSVREG